MNLTKLFEMQKVLDERIIERFPDLVNEDLLPKKILALQVELGELCQEWRGFKFWSEKQEPKKIVSSCSIAEADYLFCRVGHEKYPVDYAEEKGTYCPEHSTFLMPMRRRSLLLEEYVDCLHFILSIGNSHAMQYGAYIPIYSGFKTYQSIKYETITRQFNYLYFEIAYLMDCTSDCEIGNNAEIDDEYEQLFRLFIGLGEMLGFTWKQIEAAYYEKNQINHDRQANGY